MKSKNTGKVIAIFCALLLLAGGSYAQTLKDEEVKCLARISSFMYGLKHATPTMAEVELSLVQGLLARGTDACEIEKYLPFFKYGDKPLGVEGKP